MPTEDLYSKRKRGAGGDPAAVYTYDPIAPPLRVQIAAIWDDILGDIEAISSHDRLVKSTYAKITKTLRREYGLEQLPGVQSPAVHMEYFELREFLLRAASTEQVLDAVELSFRPRTSPLTPLDFFEFRRRAALPAAIEELNGRFREHAVGYQLVEGKILRLDNELLHVQTVQPALRFLADPALAGAQDEFLRAHEHYRHDRFKEAINDSLNSLESVLKVICSKRGWKTNGAPQAGTLIDTVFREGLVPKLWTKHFHQLRDCLATGVPPGRNNLSGHGQGGDVVEVPRHIASFMLHETASAIVFLVEAEKAMPES